MTTQASRVWILPPLLALLAACAADPPAAVEASPAWPARSAPEWDALFAGAEGWTGGDGIFSVALDGRDGLGSATAATRSLLWFSDSMIGRVDGRGRHARGARMVNNTSALLVGDRPDPARLAFHWPRDEQGAPRSVFVPHTPATAQGEWLWLGDGFVQDDALVLFGLRMARRGTGGVFDFVQRGHVLIRARVERDGALVELAQTDLPLDSPGDDERGPLALGSGLLAHGPHLYVYGTWNRGFDKQLVAARVPPAQVADPAAWRFWDGARWSRELDDLAPICGGVSSELSVTALPDGRWLLVFQEAGMGEWVAVRQGASPVGPFGPARRVWRCPEVARHEQVFTYNAKAHPHLSAPGEVLISYNVNSFDFWGEFLRDASIYRPRFVRLPVQWLAGRE